MDCLIAERRKLTAHHTIVGTSYAVALALPPVEEAGHYVIVACGTGYVGSGATRLGYLNIGIDGNAMDYEVIFGNQNIAASDIWYPFHIETLPVYMKKGQIASLMTRYSTTAAIVWAGSWIKMVKVSD